MPDDTSAVESMIVRMFEAANNGDVKGFVSVFAEDVEFRNVFGHLAKGRQAVEDWHAPMFSGPRQPGRPSFVNARLEVLDTSIRFLRPDVAAVNIKWRQTGAIAPDGQPWGTRIGLMSWVVTQENGVWAIEEFHNMDLPVQAPQN